jgi:hypothetical protein
VITQEQLGTLIVRQVVFHDVPNDSRHKESQGPVLSDVATVLDTSRKGLLRQKLIDVLGSRKAYPIVFLPSSITSSFVPGEMRLLTKDAKSLSNFVASSQKLAIELHGKQPGSVSPGLLCVIDVVMDGFVGIVLMKLERHEGAQLKLSKSGGKQTFEMSVLDDLVFTEGTRLFKTALFLRTGKGDDDFTAVACDNQAIVTSSEDLARFWMKFLGCTFADDPRVTTQRWFAASVRYVNDEVTDPVAKNDIYEALQTELKASKANFVPQKFIDEYIPEDYRKPFRDRLQADGIPLRAFKKDLQDINNRLRRRVYTTRTGAVVSVPEDHADVVTVDEDSITVKDAVTKVK